MRKEEWQSGGSHSFLKLLCPDLNLNPAGYCSSPIERIIERSSASSGMQPNRASVEWIAAIRPKYGFEWLQSSKGGRSVRLIWRPGLLLRRLYLFRFSLLASPFVFTHASSVPRVAEITRRFQVGRENQRHNRCRIGSSPGSGGQ